jgi:hypothetical protein
MRGVPNSLRTKIKQAFKIQSDANAALESETVGALIREQEHVAPVAYSSKNQMTVKVCFS